MRLPSYQELSKEQDHIGNLPISGSHLVTGPPGTGKSVMALYRTQMYTKAGKSVQLIMHSRLLSQYTSKATRQLALDGAVKTFHSWFGSFYQRTYRRRAPQIQPYVYDWQQILQDVTQDPPAEGSIPNLIIDEGQDLPKEFYVLANHLATNITVFADENQRLTEQNSTIDEIRLYGRFGDKTHSLLRNYRNTKEIAALAACFEQGIATGVAQPPEKSGPTPVIERGGGLNDFIDLLVRYERAHSDLEIGVFTPTKKLQKSIGNRLEGKALNPVQQYVGGKGAAAAELNFDAPGIKIVNYPSTKGLEFDAVFVPELQSFRTTGPDDDMTMYVLTSRAREEIFLAHSGDGTPPILTKIPRDLVEWR